MTPFEEGGGGEGGGQSTVVINFGTVDYQGGAGPEGGGNWLVSLNHSGSTPPPHTIKFTLKYTHCSVNGESGAHEYTVTGAPNVPTTDFFSVLVNAPTYAADGTVQLGLFIGEDGPEVRDGDGVLIPSAYGTPQLIHLNAY